MLKKLQATVVLLCMVSYAEAGTVSIGTVSARGEMRVDNYKVIGDATLFDGSVVETGKATANLRLDKGAQITMSTGSRGTLYSDHIVLQQGESELSASNQFQVQALGLHITPAEPNSHAVVSLKPDNTLEVASLHGSFGVTNGHGITLANVLPGRALTFAMQAGAAPPAEEFSGVGLVTFENGTYYLVTDASVKYVLTCKDPHSFVGDKVVVTGTLQGNGTSGTSLCVKSMDINGPGGMSTKKKLIIAGIIIGAAAATGIGLAVSNSSTPPASR